MKHKIFISYSRAADLAHARVLYERLQALDYAVFWDVHERLQAVEDWRAEVRADLKASSVVIACISRAYLASPTCQQELEYAASARKLLPIALEAVEWAEWPPQAASTCNAVAMAEFGSANFWGWLCQELTEAFGVVPQRAPSADRQPAADAEARDDLVDWISKTPLQLMQTAGREAALDADAMNAVDHFLFFPEGSPLQDIEDAPATATAKAKVLNALLTQALAQNDFENDHEVHLSCVQLENRVRIAHALTLAAHLFDDPNDRSKERQEARARLRKLVRHLKKAKASDEVSGQLVRSDRVKYFNDQKGSAGWVKVRKDMAEWFTETAHGPSMVVVPFGSFASDNGDDTLAHPIELSARLEGCSAVVGFAPSSNALLSIIAPFFGVATVSPGRAIQPRSAGARRESVKKD